MKLIELFESELLLMGGNAFPNLNLSRINRSDIASTIDLISNSLSPLGINKEYILNNLLGSVGKQNDSGDIDIALNNAIFDKKTLVSISNIVRKNFGDKNVQTKTLAGGQIQTAWPIAGNPEKGLIQVDFILGPAEWLKFSHHSPGLDRSQFKGVWMSTLLGVLAKMKKEYEAYDRSGNLMACVGYKYNLELGLTKSWKIFDLKTKTLKETDPNTWETTLGILIDKGIVQNDKYFNK